MHTKQKGTLGEQAVILACLEREWGVSVPVGDCHPYDLIVDTGDRLVKIQVKTAWYKSKEDAWYTDNRRTKTNRRQMQRTRYEKSDFDFCITYIPDLRVFYILPFDVFCSYGGGVSFVESRKRQRAPRSAEYRERWDLISSLTDAGEDQQAPVESYHEQACPVGAE